MLSPEIGRLTTDYDYRFSSGMHSWQVHLGEIGKGFLIQCKFSNEKPITLTKKITLHFLKKLIMHYINTLKPTNSCLNDNL